MTFLDHKSIIMHLSKFKESAVEWSKVTTPHVEDHIKVCQEEMNELKEAVKKLDNKNYRVYRKEAQKEFADVVWTHAILAEMYQLVNDTNLIRKIGVLMQEMYQAIDSDYAYLYSSEMLDAVLKSNWSKFVDYDSMRNAEARQMAMTISIAYRGRYSGVKAYDNGTFRFWVDSNGKVMKPTSYTPYEDFL